MPPRYLELTKLGENEDLTQIVSVGIAPGICVAAAVFLLVNSLVLVVCLLGQGLLRTAAR